MESTRLPRSSVDLVGLPAHGKHELGVTCDLQRGLVMPKRLDL